MGKIEELIEKYKREIHNYEKYIDGQWACEIHRISGMKIAVEVLKDAVKDLKQLKSSLSTRQDKVVVPEFVAEFIAGCKGRSYCIVDSVVVMGSENQDVLEWYNRHVRTYELAYINDYTVEKEPLYWIYDPIADQYLGYDRVTKKVWWLLKQNDGARAEITDAEIRGIGEQYRAFAVPVE